MWVPVCMCALTHIYSHTYIHLYIRVYMNARLKELVFIFLYMFLFLLPCLRLRDLLGGRVRIINTVCWCGLPAWLLVE